MTDRLADIGARITGVRQLGAVVNAMRGIAGARAQQARAQLTAIDRYTATIAAAIGQARALAPAGGDTPVAASKARALLLFCAEQGFAGAFSEHVLARAGTQLAARDVFLIGARGSVAATERGVTPVWTASMPSHSTGVPKLADTICDALLDHGVNEGMGTVDVIFADWQPGHGMAIVQRQLWPFDPPVLRPQLQPDPPLLNLTPQLLLAGLAAEYLHAQICNAALHAFAAENEARMESMAAAHGQIERQLAGLQATQRMVRQEAITAEIIELASGETASRSS